MSGVGVTGLDQSKRNRIRELTDPRKFEILSHLQTSPDEPFRPAQECLGFLLGPGRCLLHLGHGDPFPLRSQTGWGRRCLLPSTCGILSDHVRRSQALHVRLMSSTSFRRIWMLSCRIWILGRGCDLQGTDYGTCQTGLEIQVLILQTTIRNGERRIFASELLGLSQSL